MSIDGGTPAAPAPGRGRSRRSTRVGVGALLLALVGLPASSHAVDTNLTATDTLIVEARSDNRNGELADDRYGIVINRLNLNGNAGDISSQLRIDAFAFANLCGEALYNFVPSDDVPRDGYGDAADLDGDGSFEGIDLDGDGFPDALDLDGDGSPDRLPRCVPIDHGRGAAYRNDVQLERINVAYRRGDWTLTAGDFFRQLGRGIILAVRKVDEAGLDVSLQGAMVEYRGRDHRGAVFAGRTNPAQLDSINQLYVEPVDDVIAGYSYELRAIDEVRIGFFGAFVQPEQRVVESERDYTYSQGLSVELPSPTDWLALYAEGDVQTRSIGGGSVTGLGSYVTASFNIRDFSVLVEGLYLDDFRQPGSGNTALSGAPFRHNQAPTLERIDQETLNSPTVLGGRARLEQYFFDADTNVYVNGNLLMNNRDEPSELRQMHGYAGFETYYQDGNSRIELSGGYRDETQTNLPPVDNGFATVTPGHRQLKSMRHAELDWLQFLGNGYSLHLTSNNEVRELDGQPYERGSTFVGVDRAGLGGLTFEFGYDTQFEGGEFRNLFFAGIVKWEASDAITVSATGGTQRGGIKCINGVCREYPAFSGGRVELVGRF